MLAVFDFDKTLTHKDTIFGFYKEVDGGHTFFQLKKCMLLFFAVFSKLGIIDNTKLKKIGVRLFLKNKSENLVKKAGKTYAKKIKLNDFYKSHYLKYNKSDRMIVSASFDVYLQELFPEENIIASKLKYKEGKVSALANNMYGALKKDHLSTQSIEFIDVFYTDSFSDRSLMEISDEVYLIKNRTIKCIKKSGRHELA